MDQNEIKKAAEAYIQQEAHPKFKTEVENLLKEGNWPELTERFYTTLSFGTGGLRGIIGGGTNRMNPLVVRSSTQGLANYVNKAVSGPKSAVIAYDSRNYSDLFALEAALVLAANGIKTYVFTALRPTPELSFAVRYLGASTGIVVTASHNPSEYNGYKVYWNDGAQVLAPHDVGIIEEVRGVKTVKTLDRAQAEAQGLLVWIDESVDRPYLDMIKSQVLRPEIFTSAKSAKIVYTPLHGTGGALLPGLVKELGLDLIPVPEQSIPDGNFPTVPSPNPEEASALKMGLELAKARNADLLIGTDPDADRIGIAVPQGQEWVLLNGNQLGALLTEYVFSTLATSGKMPKNPVFLNTIVTTDLQNIIAESYGAKTYKVLTGFKYIGEKIREFETMADKPQYIFGGEESYGFLLGTAVRDKDAISAAVLTIEMVLYLQSQGRSVVQELERIYEKYGYFKEILISKTFKGQAGLQKMKDFMAGLRVKAPEELGGIALAKLLDYLPGKDLPSSDVVQFILSEGSLVSVRPSGTEPKIKFYASCRASKGLTLAAAKKEVDDKLQRINQALDAMIG